MGEGHKLCQALGAKLADMAVTPSLTSDLPPAAAWSMFAVTLVVDAQGNRFANEDYMRTLAATCFSEERGYFWTIFDGRISESGQSRSAAQITAKNASRVVGPCQTVEELAGNMGVSEDVLKKTWDRYSSMVGAGKDSDFGRLQFLDDLKPPYYALKQFPVRFRTRGGAVVDESGRLLDGAGKAIPGVYCCGAAAQGGRRKLDHERRVRHFRGQSRRVRPGRGIKAACGSEYAWRRMARGRARGLLWGHGKLADDTT